MSAIDENNLALYKALSQFIEKELLKKIAIIESQCEKKIVVFDKCRNKFLSSETFDEVGKNSKELEKLKNEIDHLVAAQDRMEIILRRNQQRISYLQANLDKIGVYNDGVDKKTIDSSIKSCEEISENALNLNQNAKDNIVYRLFEGEILAFVDDKLDFSLDINQDVLLKANADFIHKVIEQFPYSVATIPDEIFMYNRLKNNILKECILFISSNIKGKSFSELNYELGEPLDGVEGVENISQYAEELKNNFNVAVKQQFRKNNPELADDFEDKLICNEASPFLPSSKRVAVLANGMAGDVQKTEEQESEDIRKDQEQEDELVNQIDLFLDELVRETEEEQQEQEDAIQKREREEAEKEKEAQKQQEEKKELEQELESMLRKNDGDDN